MKSSVQGGVTLPKLRQNIRWLERMSPAKGREFPAIPAYRAGRDVVISKLESSSLDEPSRGSLTS